MDATSTTQSEAAAATTVAVKVRAWQKPWVGVLLIAFCISLLALGGYLIGSHVYAEFHLRAAVRSLEAAERTQREINLQKALAHFKVAIGVWPNNARVHFLLARTARRLADYDLAENHLAQSSKRGWVAEHISLERFLIQAQRGEIEKTEGYLTACVNGNHEDSVLILEAMTYGCIRTYQIQKALGCIKVWLNLDGDNLRALQWRAQLRRLLSQYLEAEEDYRRILELDPENDDSRQNLAEMLIYAHKANEALPHLELLLDKDPGNAALVLGLARAKIETGEVDEGRKILDRLLGDKPDNVQALAESGKLLVGMQQFAEAERRLLKAHRLMPNERETLYWLYRLRVVQGRLDEAKAYEILMTQVDNDQKLLKETTYKIMVTPHDPELRRQAGEIMIRNGQEAEGLRWLDSALQVSPWHVATHRYLEEYFTKKGNLARAAEHRRKAIHGEALQKTS